ncbi:MAG: cell wall-binding repeat-containing protein [Coriobacteriia bacterium]
MRRSSTLGDSGRRTLAVVLSVALMCALALPALAVEPLTWQESLPLLRVSVTTEGEELNDDAYDPWPSDDGRYVVYQSGATTITPNDNNGDLEDIFMYDVVSMETTLVSAISTSASAWERGSRDPSVSDDGQHVAFYSGKDFVETDVNGGQDLYVKNMATGDFMLADVTGNGSSPGREIYDISISGNGHFVVMESYYDVHPDDTNGARDVYLWDMESGDTTIVSTPTSVSVDTSRGSRDPSVSDDGRYVAFFSGVDFVLGDTNGAQDLYVKDMMTGEYMRADLMGDGSSPQDDLWNFRISGDGSRVVFESREVLDPATDLNGTKYDIYLWDMASDETTLVSAPREGALEWDRGSRDPAISDDGRFVSLFTGQDLIATDTNGMQDLYVKDMESGELFRVELAADGDSPGDDVWDFAMSGDGNFMAFSSSELLVRPDTNGSSDIFLRKLWPEAATDPLRVSGDNRYETAVAMSEQAFPDGAEAVVIATGTNWPDALGGSALAGAVGGPILLTDPMSLNDMVADEIERLGATDAYILGGYSAVSLAVENELEAMLGGYVNRISGADRYGTSKAVANRAIAIMGYGYDGTVCVATGADYPDAMAAAPLAAGLGWPIVLADPATGTVYKPADMTSAVILGGDGAVSPAIEADLKSGLGDDMVVRKGGASRYSTAALIATYGTEMGLGWNGVGIASGESFPDGLAGGASLGQLRTVMLLTPAASLDPAASATLDMHKAHIMGVHFLGGTAAVSSAVQTAVETILGL